MPHKDRTGNPLDAPVTVVDLCPHGEPRINGRPAVYCAECGRETLAAWDNATVEPAKPSQAIGTNWSHTMFLTAHVAMVLLTVAVFGVLIPGLMGPS